MKAYEKNRLVMLDADRIGIEMTQSQAHILRRASLTLKRWFEAECNGDVQQDETSGQFFRHYGRGTRGPFLTVKCADREKGARKRIADTCKEIGCHYYIQTDPRGNALYISKDELTEQNYYRGLAV